MVVGRNVLSGGYLFVKMPEWTLIWLCGLHLMRSSFLVRALARLLWYQSIGKMQVWIFYRLVCKNIFGWVYQNWYGVLALRVLVLLDYQHVLRCVQLIFDDRVLCVLSSENLGYNHHFTGYDDFLRFWISFYGSHCGASGSDAMSYHPLSGCLMIYMCVFFIIVYRFSLKPNDSCSFSCYIVTWKCWLWMLLP